MSPGYTSDRRHRGCAGLCETSSCDSKNLYCYLGTLLTGDTEAVLACVRPAAVIARIYTVTWVHF